MSLIFMTNAMPTYIIMVYIVEYNIVVETCPSMTIIDYYDVQVVGIKSETVLFSIWQIDQINQ